MEVLVPTDSLWLLSSLCDEEYRCPALGAGTNNNLATDLFANTQVAIEFTTASVTAPGVDLLAAKLPGDASTMLAVAEAGLHLSNADTMHFSNIRQRGRLC